MVLTEFCDFKIVAIKWYLNNFFFFYNHTWHSLTIQLQSVLTYNKTTKVTYVTALLLTCLLLTYIEIPKTSLQQTKGLLKTINK